MTIRVLICDDVAELRTLYRISLANEADIDLVGEARDGEEAIALADALDPDVILLDVHMPNKNGLEALEEIHLDHPETKVIMLTSLEGEGISKRAEELGATDYIVKGTGLDEIADRIRLTMKTD